MRFQSACLLPNALSALFAQSYNEGRITLADRHALRLALCHENLNYDEQLALNRLLHAVRRGWIKISS